MPVFGKVMLPSGYSQYETRGTIFAPHSTGQNCIWPCHKKTKQFTAQPCIGWYVAATKWKKKSLSQEVEFNALNVNKNTKYVETHIYLFDPHIFIWSSWYTQPSYSLAWFHYHLRWWSGFVCNSRHVHSHCRYHNLTYHPSILQGSRGYGLLCHQMSGCSFLPGMDFIKWIQ